MSGEAIPYHLRQNKHVDRQLFVQLLSHVDRATPINKALYISFGGVYFEDFKLIHQVFGTNKLISVERLDWIFRRQRHNRPYGCINCKQMTSRRLVESIEEIRGMRNGPLICWLDFAEASTRRGQLEDINIFSTKARELDVIRVTMNVNAETLGEHMTGETKEARDQRRLEHLRNKFADKLDREIVLDDATQNGFPGFCLEMLKRAIQSGLKSSPGMGFLPLGSFTYADSNHTMLTLTGTFLNGNEVDDYIAKTRVKQFEFAQLDWKLIHINVPLLSLREKLLLDQRFGAGKSAARVAATLGFRFDKEPAVSQMMLKSYFQFHRYYPHFHRIHY